MNSISNDHPSAYYRCDYEPFVCFIKALNPRGFNESWDVKLSSSRMGRSQELLDVAWRVFVFLNTFLFVVCEFVLIAPSDAVRIINGFCWNDNASWVL